MNLLGLCAFLIAVFAGVAWWASNSYSVDSVFALIALVFGVAVMLAMIFR